MGRDRQPLDQQPGQSESPARLFSIANQLRYGLVFLVALSVLVTGGILIFLSFQAQSQQLRLVQQERSRVAAGEINAYLDDLQRKINYLSRIRGLTDLSPEIQHNLLEGLIRHNSAYQSVAIVDEAGQVVTSAAATLTDNPVDTTLFERVFKRQEDFVGPVEVDPISHLPLVTVAVPIRNSQDEVAGVLLARIDLSFLWFIISRVEVGQSGYIYVIDNRNMILAKTGATPETFSLEDISDRPFIQNLPAVGSAALTTYQGLKDVEVIGSLASVQTTRWRVLIELPTAEAYAPLRNMLLIMGAALTGAIALAIGLGLMLTRQIVAPLQELTEASAQVSAGNMAVEVRVDTRNEMQLLATTFNTMTAQVRHLVDGLESRARRMEIVANLGERLSAILDLNQLLNELVRQVEENFEYSHTQVYLLDDEGQNLISTAWTNAARQAQPALAPSIPLNAAHPVAQAARSGEIVVVDNSAELEAGPPHPALPETQTEMAVPIMLEGTVVGVLDVRERGSTALDKGDANLLRLLANQMAVALTNARLFEQTLQAKEAADQAKEEAQATNRILEEQIWQTRGQAQLNDQLQGEQDLLTLANRILRQLCRYLEAQIGALYIAEDHHLNLVGRYAYSNHQSDERFKFGEGLVGQAAAQKRPLIVTDVPDNYIKVDSGLGDLAPRHIITYPFVYEDRVLGVIELGTLATFNQKQLDFLQNALMNIAIAFNTAQARARIIELLTETQRQTDELQTQGEKLQAANKELALANQYKSDFLSTMSHELRTPLNSLLILARILAANTGGNLTEEQVGFAQIIYSAGTDLLSLINDILDLAKVEAGNLLFDFQTMALTDLTEAMQTQFNHVAQERGLTFEISLAAGLPRHINTDEQRLKQIVRNLLSNAFKFTSAGSVCLKIERAEATVNLSKSGLTPAEALAIRVIDTGIGISPDQQQVIFDAFQQVDSGISRRYGGTGLGLTISRELAAHLGGQIELSSDVGRGSTFSLYLPLTQVAELKAVEPIRLSQVSDEAQAAELSLTRPVEHSTAASTGRGDHQMALEEENTIPLDIQPISHLSAGDSGSFKGKKVLVVDDDPRNSFALAKLLTDQGIIVSTAENGQKALDLLALDAVDLVLMDIMMPVLDGYEATRRIRTQAQFQTLPILALTAKAMAGDQEDCLAAGANDYLVKPVDIEQLFALLRVWLV